MIWTSLFGKILATFLLSMVPVLELRGAIPIAAANGLPLRIAIPVSVIGNLVPVPLILLFIRRIFVWLRTKNDWWDRRIAGLESRTMKKADTVRRCAFWGLALFVAIPLPGTGAWTGALIAALLQLRMKQALPAIALGVIGAGVLVTFVTYGAVAVLFGGGVAA